MLDPRLSVVAAAAAVLAACAEPRDGAEIAGAGLTGCTPCHGDPTRDGDLLARAAPPLGATGGDGAAHLGHVRARVACASCHEVPSRPDHADGEVGVRFAGVAVADGAAPRWDGATCSNVYCHGATRPGGDAGPIAWRSGTLACTSCHGAPPASHAPSSTACHSCHPGTVQEDGTLDRGSALHANGTVEAGGTHAAGWSAKDQHGYSVNRTGLSSCKACHGTNLDGVGGTGPSCASCHAAAGFAGWATGCTFCHGDRQAGQAAPPVDTQGQSAPTNVSVGLHAAHLGTTLMAAPLTCGACHPDRSGSNVVTDAAHVDGSGAAEVVFGALARTGGAAATYTRTSATAASCASVYCHGRFAGGTSATVSWTSAAQVTCTSCHGAPPATGEHGEHSGRSCGDCHPGSSRTAVNRATHLDGAKQVGNRITGWDASTRSCTNTCHSSETW